MMYYLRIAMAERRFWRASLATYSDWAATVPAFVPKFGAHPAVLDTGRQRFSLRHVIKREYNGVFAIVFGMFFLERPDGGLGAPAGTAANGKQAWEGVWRCSCSCAS